MIIVLDILLINRNIENAVHNESLFLIVLIILFPEELLWVAPELLAEHTATNLIPATQKGDVYSFSIVLEEIVVRGGPYEFVKNDLTTQGKYYVFLFS